MRLHALYLIGAFAVTAIPLSAGAQSLPANEQWTSNAQAVNQPVQKCAPGWVFGSLADTAGAAHGVLPTARRSATQ
jgi:hypothetical protein